MPNLREIRDGGNRTQYSTRCQRRRKPLSSAIRHRIIERDGGLCQYCQEDPATFVDHIVPWSYGGRDDDDNLVASCGICNLVASDKVFDTFDDKKKYINDRINAYLIRKARSIRRKLSVCPDCDEIFMPNVGGATAILCGPCNRNDLAYDEPTRKERNRQVDEINRAIRRLREEAEGYA